MSHQRHLTTAFKIAPCVVSLVSVRIQQAILLKFQPAHINQTLHLMLQGHTVLNGMPQGSSTICTCCIRVISSEKWRFEGTQQGLWLPLHYQVDMGASQHMMPEFGVNPTGFSLQNSFLGWCFGLCQRWCLALVVWQVGFVVDLGIAFMDKWVVGKEKG